MSRITSRLKKLYQIREIKDIKDLLLQSSQLFADKHAFLVRDSEGNLTGITYNQFQKDVNALGTALISLGLKDNRIAILGENRYEWCVSYLATVNGTGVVVPIDKELMPGDVEFILERSEVSCVFFSKPHLENMERISKINPNIKYFVCMDAQGINTSIEPDRFILFEDLLEKGRNLLEEGEASFVNAQIDNSEMNILLFTSGTTSFSKGVMLSHRNICANILSVRKTVNVAPGDVTLSILPLHHTYECTLGFLCIIYSGGTISFSEGLRRIPMNLKETKPTIMITVPLLLENVYRKVWDQAKEKPMQTTALKSMLFIGNSLKKTVNLDIRKKMFQKIYDSLGGNLRLIIVGAAAIDPQVSKFFRHIGISVLQGYGLTECSPLVAGNRDNAFKDSSVGVAIPDVEIKIDQPNEEGVGEIITRGENVMLGYFKDEEATEESLRDGWFYTGDLGQFVKDGFLYISGRVKNVIVTKNGKNIYPEELEMSINRLPVVAESMVSGVSDEKTGDIVVHVQIVPNMDAVKEALKSMTVTKEDIKKTITEAIVGINRTLPLYKHIKGITIREKEFAKTTTQKIKRHLEKKTVPTKA